MSEQNNTLKDFILKQKELDQIRKWFPKINLFDKPLIGTEEVRQYVYCKRIIYFRHILNAEIKNTYKMEYGMKKHEKLQELAEKNKDAPQKYFNIYLTDPESGLVGLIDYFEFDGNEAYPVEIKTGKEPYDEMDISHKMQVTAQTILIEKNFDFLVKKVKIFYTKTKKFVEYPITINDKLKVLEILDEIFKMLDSEKIPGPTEHKGKCVDCECRNYCMRS